MLVSDPTPDRPAPDRPAPDRPTPEDLLASHGTTYAEQAGITLRDKPMPLFQLLVLTQLSSIRISADTAAAAAHELFRAGWRTPERLRGSTWQERVDALGRGGYRRYDESTADYLDELAARVQDAHRGDLRRIRPRDSDSGADADDPVAALRDELTDFPRIGPTGADIFCREVQAVWPEVRPHFDDRARTAAGQLGYPTSARALADLVADEDVARFSAALVRWSLDGSG